MIRNPQYAHPELLSKIEELEKKIARSNDKGLIAQVYNLADQDATGFERNIVDSAVSADKLLFGNPLEFSVKRYKLARYSIDDIKQLLTHCDTKGHNLLLRHISGIGENSIEGLLKAISFYDEQVDNQFIEWDYLLDDCDDSKIFYANSDIKEEMVSEQIKESAEYLVDNSEECIWGVLSDSQKRNILSAVNNNTTRDFERRKALIDIFTNYSSYYDLKEGLVRTRSIDKLIVK